MWNLMIIDFIRNLELLPQRRDSHMVTFISCLYSLSDDTGMYLKERPANWVRCLWQILKDYMKIQK